MALLDDPVVTSVDLDVLVLGDDREATDLVCALADAIPGVRGIYGGRLRNAAQVEALAANLIAINDDTGRTPASGSPASDPWRVRPSCREAVDWVRGGISTPEVVGHYAHQ